MGLALRKSLRSNCDQPSDHLGQRSVNRCCHSQRKRILQSLSILPPPCASIPTTTPAQKHNTLTGRYLPLASPPTSDDFSALGLTDKVGIRAMATGEKRPPRKGEWYVSGGDRRSLSGVQRPIKCNRYLVAESSLQKLASFNLFQHKCCLASASRRGVLRCSGYFVNTGQFDWRAIGHTAGRPFKPEEIR